MRRQIKKKIDICLVVDRSGSLKSLAKIINDALKFMLEAIKKDEYLHGCDIYFTLVSFANDWNVVVNFKPIEEVSPDSLELTFTGHTNPGPALRYVADKAFERYYTWKEAGEAAFHPLIFFFTDGYPFPPESYMPEYEEVAEIVKAMDEQKKILIVCAGYGAEANIDALKMLTSDEKRVLAISKDNTEKLTEFFKDIIKVTTHSVLTDTIDQLNDALFHYAQS